jgi:hypothetical protein
VTDTNTGVVRSSIAVVAGCGSVEEFDRGGGDEDAFVSALAGTLAGPGGAGQASDHGDEATVGQVSGHVLAELFPAFDFDVVRSGAPSRPTVIRK